MKTVRAKVFGTWKNRLTVSESCQLAREIAEYVGTGRLGFELSVCPPMIALALVKQVLPPHIALTAQNLVWDDSISFTGETTARALKEIGCKYVIIGHSERRIYLGEDDAMVAKKVATAMNDGLIPVVCVGEFYENYQTGQSESVIRRQIEVIISSLRQGPEVPRLVIAYEPAWAISTSREALRCDPAEANSRHKLIRDIISAEWGREYADRLTLLYGGSVSASNATEYFAQSDIDGGLVGTASQSRNEFIGLIEAARKVFSGPSLEN